MKIGRLLKRAARTVKDNPEIALVVLGVVAPKVARKIVEVQVARRL